MTKKLGRKLSQSTLRRLVMRPSKRWPAMSKATRSPRRASEIGRPSFSIASITARADAATTDRLGRFGRAIGLAFQIADDVLDVEATSEQLGKTAGKDRASGKITYPAVYGLPESRRRADQLVAQALAELAPFGPRADLLRALARTMVHRQK